MVTRKWKGVFLLSGKVLNQLRWNLMWCLGGWSGKAACLWVMIGCWWRGHHLIVLVMLKVLLPQVKPYLDTTWLCLWCWRCCCHRLNRTWLPPDYACDAEGVVATGQTVPGHHLIVLVMLKVLPQAKLYLGTTWLCLWCWRCCHRLNCTWAPPDCACDAESVVATGQTVPGHHLIMLVNLVVSLPQAKPYLGTTWLCLWCWRCNLLPQAKPYLGTTWLCLWWWRCCCHRPNRTWAPPDCACDDEGVTCCHRPNRTWAPPDYACDDEGVVATGQTVPGHHLIMLVMMKV